MKQKEPENYQDRLQKTLKQANNQLIDFQTSYPNEFKEFIQSSLIQNLLKSISVYIKDR